MAWFVGRRDIDRLFDEGHVRLRDCIDAVERSFAEHGEGNVGVLPRQMRAMEVRHVKMRHMKSHDGLLLSGNTNQLSEG